MEREGSRETPLRDSAFHDVLKVGLAQMQEQTKGIMGFKPGWPLRGSRAWSLNISIYSAEMTSSPVYIGNGTVSMLFECPLQGFFLSKGNQVGFYGPGIPGQLSSRRNRFDGGGQRAIIARIADQSFTPFEAIPMGGAFRSGLLQRTRIARVLSNSIQPPPRQALPPNMENPIANAKEGLVNSARQTVAPGG